MPRLSPAARGERVEARRSAITAAAIGVFSAKGFRGATIEEIADAAGVAEGTVYLYFRSKRDLLVQAWQQVAVQSLVPLLSEGEMTPEARLEAIVRNRVNLITEQAPLMRAMMAEAEHDPTLHGEIARQLGALLEVGERYLSEGMRSGMFRRLPTPAIIRVIASAVMGLAITEPFFRHVNLNVANDTAAGTLSTMLLHGLLSHAERG